MLPFHLQYILYGKSSGLFIRPVYTKKVSFKMNTAGWSRTKVRIENDIKVTKSMNMEQEPFMKDFFDSCGILTILRSDYWEERIMSTLLIGNAENEENVLINTKLIHFTMCTTDLVQSPQRLQVIIVDNDLESVIKLNQHYKTFHPELSYNLSRCKRKWNYFLSKFWLYPVPINVSSACLTIQKGVVIPHTDIILKTHSIFSMANSIGNQNPFIIKGKDNFPQSTAAVFILSDHEYLRLYIVPLQEYFVEVFVRNQTYVLLKGCTVDKQYLYTSTVSLVAIYLAGWYVTMRCKNYRHYVKLSTIIQ